MLGGLDEQNISFLELSKAVPGLQKIPCSRLERNDPCSRPENDSILVF